MVIPRPRGAGGVDASSLLAAQPEALQRAGKHWMDLAEKFGDKVAAFGKEVRDPLEDDTVWRGEGAQAAYEYANDLHGKMKEYVDDVDAVGKALTSAAGEIDSLKLELERLVIEIENTPEFAINKKTFEINYPLSQKSLAERYAADIEGLVERAVSADQTYAEKVSNALEKQRFLQDVLKEERKEERAEGREAAQRLTKCLEAGKRPPGALRELLENNADDEYFAAAMAKALGTEGILNLPALIGELEISDQATKTLMTSVAEMVGTATDGKGPAIPYDIRQALINAAGSTEMMGQEDVPGHRGQGEDRLGYRKFWAMQKLLQFGEGEFGGNFLADVSQEIYNNRDELRSSLWDDNGSYNLEYDEWSLSGTGTGADPMLTVMQSLREAPEAGRMFFGHDPNGDGTLERVVTLMNEYPPNIPEGPQVTEALRVASTEFDQIDPNRSTWAYENAAAIASNFMHETVEHQDDWVDGPTNDEVRRDVSSVLSYYYEDLQHSLSVGTGEESDVGARDYPYKDSPTEFQTGAMISSSDAQELVNLVFENPETKDQLLQAARVYGELRLNYEVEHAVDVTATTERDESGRPIADGFSDYGSDLGRLIGAANGTAMEDAQASQLISELGAAALNIGVATGGAVLGPVGALGTAALGEVAKAGLEGMTTDPGEVRDQMRAQIHDAQAAAEMNVAEMMIRNGYWEGPPPPDEYWNEETQTFQCPPDDPTTARNEQEEFEAWIHRQADQYIVMAHNSFMTGLEAGVAEGLKDSKGE